MKLPDQFSFPQKGSKTFPASCTRFWCGVLLRYPRLRWFGGLEGVGRVPAVQCSSHCLCWQGVHLCAGSEGSAFNRPGLAAAWDLGQSHRQAGVGAWQRGAAAGPGYPVDRVQIADKPRGFHGAQGKQLALVWHCLPTCLVYLWELKLNNFVALFSREERLLFCWQRAIP